MKVKTNYSKQRDGVIKAEVFILRHEDYLTSTIFNSNKDYPTNDGFYLGYGEVCRVSKIFDTAAEAEKWAEEQIDALKRHLDSWRQISVPDSKEYDL